MVSPGGKRAVHERRLYYGTLVNSNVRHGRTVADVRLHGFAHASDVYILIFFLRAARIKGRGQFAYVAERRRAELVAGRIVKGKPADGRDCEPGLYVCTR